LPRPRRFEWPRRSAIAYDAGRHPSPPGRNRVPISVPARVPECSATACPLASRPFVCRTPDGGGSGPNCFAHDHERSGARKQPGAVDNESCRAGTFAGFRSRAATELRMSRVSLVRAGSLRARWKTRLTAWILSPPGSDSLGRTPTGESDATRDQYAKNGPCFWWRDDFEAAWMA
jgi:hypothetical protein